MAVYIRPIHSHVFGKGTTIDASHVFILRPLPLPPLPPQLWSTRDWSLLKVLAGHEGKVMAADIAPRPVNGDQQQQQDGDTGMADAEGNGDLGAGLQHLIGSAGYDRTVKLWAPQETPDLFVGIGDDLPF